MRRAVGRAVRGPLRRTTWVGLAAVTATLALLLGVGALVQPPLSVPDERFHLDVVTAVMEGGGYPSPGSRVLTGDTQALSRLLGLERTRSTALPGGTTFQQDPPACTGGPIPDCDRSPRLEELEAYEGVFSEDRPSSMAQHPPLFYALTGGGAVLLTGMSPAPVPIDLLLLLLRILSMGWLVLLPFLLFALARQLGAGERVALVASVLCLLPSSLTSRIGPMVNNDALSMTLAAAMLVVAAVAALQVPASRRTQVLLGVLAGLGTLTKGLLIAFPALLVLVPLWGLWQRTISRRVALVQVALGLAAWFVSGGWWLVRNLVAFGTLQPRVPRVSGSPPTELGVADWAVDWVAGTTRSFFGGWMPWTNSWRLWVVVGLVLVLVALGFRRLPPVRRGLVVVLAIPPAATVGGVLVTSLGVFLDDGLVKGAQGRYLLMGLALLAAVAAIGLCGSMQTSRQRIGAAAVVAALALLQAVNFVRRMYAWGDRGSPMAERWADARWWSPIGPDLFDVSLVLAAVLSLVLLAVVGWVLVRAPADGSVPVE